jgi:hypothetical protein
MKVDQIKIDRGRVNTPIRKSDDMPLPYGWGKSHEVSKAQVKKAKKLLSEANMVHGNRCKECARIGKEVGVSSDVIRRIKLGEYED